ncbi:MAG TPA: hypothetical protein VFM37_01945 [Pseudonocardiaceae bacterium]|nr:hypothetical protein [Pseudonocardiaceae bacterium]
MNSIDPTLVRRLRVTYLGTCAQRDLGDLGVPSSYRALLCAPRPAAGLELTLPFLLGKNAKWSAEHEFWREVCERTESQGLPPPDSDRAAARMLRMGVPLRGHGTLSAPGHKPRLELYLYPFGCAALATVDLLWPQGTTLTAAFEQLTAAEDAEATANAGTASVDTTLRQVAPEAAVAVCALFNATPKHTVMTPTHRIVTVIDAAVPELATMPEASGPIHRDMHRLAAGDDPPEEPRLAFVARWVGRSFRWSPADLVYMLDRGTTALAAGPARQRPADAKRTTSTRHRNLTLTLMHVSASAAVVRLSRESPTMFNQDWARDSAHRIGRLYGPKPVAARYWGLEPRQFLDPLSVEAVEAVLGQPLQPAQLPPQTYP